MKLWLVFFLEGMGANDLLGIYSSEEKAKEYVAERLRKSSYYQEWDFPIEEHYLDVPTIAGSND